MRHFIWAVVPEGTHIRELPQTAYNYLCVAQPNQPDPIPADRLWESGHTQTAEWLTLVSNEKCSLCEEQFQKYAKWVKDVLVPTRLAAQPKGNPDLIG